MAERQMFRKLISVSGIGPKGAMAILAFGEPGQVIHAIEMEEEKFLTKFPGVGKKTARQMILDLKGKLNDVMPEGMIETDSESKHKGTQVSVGTEVSDFLDEALLALSALGYSERELKRVAPKLAANEMTTDQYIKSALQMLLK